LRTRGKSVPRQPGPGEPVVQHSTRPGGTV
jgi:hypothetical protein